jgi:hypothetical protein
MGQALRRVDHRSQDDVGNQSLGIDYFVISRSEMSTEYSWMLKSRAARSPLVRGHVQSPLRWLLLPDVDIMPKKKVAAIVTEYRQRSHADEIVGKIVEGYGYDNGPGPAMTLAALYVDQFPARDTSRALAKKYGFPIFDSIDKAVTLGGKSLAVDGVLIVAEHGEYPNNARGQKLYPKRAWFTAVADVFARTGRSVPVFNDKHFGPVWEDAKWTYDRARELFVPLMGGSTIPLMWRRPALELPKGCVIDEVVQVGYGPMEGYGFHAVEGLQCMVERRQGGEVGVKSVQSLSGQAMWQALDAGRWSRSCLDAALPLVPAHAKADIREITTKDATAATWLIEYRDGLRAAIFIPNGWSYEGPGGGFTFAARLKGDQQPRATQFHQQLLPPMGHFIYQLKAIEAMLRTGHSPVPAERTLLTSGILDAAMTSMADKGRVVETPHLAIRYQPIDWPYATDPLPKLVNR